MIKPKVYLIPGTMCNEKLWDGIVKELGDNYDLVHLAIPLGENIDAIVDLLIEKMGFNDVRLVGFSFGGYLASAIAIKIPSRIKSLIIISHSPCSLSSQELKNREEGLALIVKYGYKGISREKASTLFGETSVNDKSLRIIRDMDAELGEKTLVNQLSIGSERKDLALDLLGLGILTTLIYSESDPMVNHQWIADFQSNAPAVRVLPLPGSGHMLPIEKPLELANSLRNVLADSCANNWDQEQEGEQEGTPII